MTNRVHYLHVADWHLLNQACITIARALHAARQWADDHGHPQPDDRMLAAYGAVIAGQVRQDTADQGADILRQILIEHGETSQWTKADGRVISLCECGHECIGDDAVDAMIALDWHIVQAWREAIARRAGDGDGTATT